MQPPDVSPPPSIVYSTDEKQRLDAFFRLVAGKSEAVALCRVYYRYRDDDRLMQMYNFSKSFLDAGILAIADGYRRAATTVADAEAKGIALNDANAYGRPGPGRGGGNGVFGFGGGGGPKGLSGVAGWFGGGVARQGNGNATSAEAPGTGSPAAIALDQRLDGLRRGATFFSSRVSSSSSSTSSSSSASAARATLTTAALGSGASQSSSTASSLSAPSGAAAVNMNASSAALEFARKSTEEQIELLVYQNALEKKFGGLDIIAFQQQQQVGLAAGVSMPPPITFLDLSVSKTIHQLLVLAKSHPGHRNELFGEASKLQKQFKVPDKRFWHVKVRSLAMSHQWDELRKFANEKKSPIGYVIEFIALSKF